MSVTGDKVPALLFKTIKPALVDALEVPLHLFLKAIAHGADSTWPPGSDARARARRIREELMALLGGAATNALLRMVSRDGRLSPGLAPAVEGETVNSEKGAMTPAEEVHRWFARRHAAGTPVAEPQGPLL